jgi:hypothetical protein
MSSFKGRISEDEAQSIRAYLIQRANDLKSGSAAGH